jgi:hypothetical protein
LLKFLSGEEGQLVDDWQDRADDLRSATEEEWPSSRPLASATTLDTLKELGIDDILLAVFASDNGPFGEAAREFGN